MTFNFFNFFLKTISKKNNAQLYCVLILLVFCFSCALAEEKAQPKLPVKTYTIVRKDGGEIIIKAEIAESAAQREKGLMFRKELKDGEGMLFVFPADRVLSFYMKNTIVPLSIAFINKEGVIAEIHDMEPLNLRSIQSSRSLRYALEVPQGWFSSVGVAVGDTINF
jgi:uncharacterized membrane protein (UPF0127 family)